MVGPLEQRRGSRALIFVLMKCRVSTGNWLPLLCAALAAGLLVSAAAVAQEVEHQTIVQPGGMPGTPIITGIQPLTNGVRITWDGPAGYYQLWKRSFTSQAWQPVGGLTTSRSAVVTGVTSNTLFRVSGPAPQYAGLKSCSECHGSVANGASRTPHAGAFVDREFAARGGQTNSSCLPCHTVGFGLRTGFVSANDLRSTNLLAGVQCENCHAPAGNHAANPDDLSVKPRIDVAATVCGGCHSASTFPTYQEWQSSGHAFVTEENMNPTSCGRCHIGSARIAMLKSEPVDDNDRNVPIVCAVCHDPHQTHTHANVLNGVVSNAWTGLVITNRQLGATYTNQVRNPFASTQDYFLSTSDIFASKYDPEVNICGQCHNHRGANWRSSTRPPHHSPQYNFLLGSVGELPSGSLTNANNHLPASHSLLEKQCVSCHMQMTEGEVGPPETPAVTGHGFRVDRYDACADCHPMFVDEFVAFTQQVVNDRIQRAKNALDQWALVKQGGMLGNNYYGALAWEYTNPGDLSSGRGPTAADQALIPDNIKKARFNLYLVLYDGSYGVHNGYLAGALLDAAENWVAQEMAR
jgi:ferredoxin